MNDDSAGATDLTGDDALLDDLIEQVAEQCRAGQGIDLEALVTAHPQYEATLREIVPTIAALEVSVPSDSETAPPSASPGRPQINRQIGEFRLLHELGRGGMGIVYEAEQSSLGRRVALKVFPMAGLLDDRQLQRFKNEARAAASLHHPNIVPVFSVGSDKGVHFYAMQLIEGQTVAQRISQTAGEGQPAAKPAKRETAESADLAFDAAQPTNDANATTAFPAVQLPAAAMPQAQIDTDVARHGGATATASSSSLRTTAHFRSVAELGIQVAEALHYAHSLGIVHRDIKPSNLLLDAQGKTWVADFGLAQIEADASLTMTGDLIGTVRYMSPEQALGRPGLVDSRTDIYSLGITLYELLVGRPAYADTDRQRLLRRLLDQDPPPLRQLNSAIPRDLETIVHKTIAKEPQSRYATAHELAEDLRRFLKMQPVLAKRPTLVDRSLKWLRRHPSLIAASILVLLTTSVALAVSTLLISAAYEQEGNERQRAEQAVEEESRQRLMAETLRKEADDQRIQAEANFRDALAAVDQMLVRVSEERLNKIPQMQSVRRELMSDAVEFYNRFLERRPDDPQVRLDVAKTLTKLGDVSRQLQEEPEAERYYRRARALLTSEVFADQANFHKAFKILQNVLTQLGNATRNQRRFEESQKFFTEHVQVARDQTDRYPHVAQSHADLAAALVRLANFQHLSSNTLKDAEKNVKEAIQLHPNSAAHLCLGRILEAQGRWDEAHSHLSQAVAVGSGRTRDEATSLFYLAKLELRQGKLTQAADHYQQAIVRFQDDIQDTPGDNYILQSWRQAIDDLLPLLKRLERHDEVRDLADSVIDLCTEILHSPLSASLPLRTAEDLWEVQSKIYELHLSLDAAEQRARQNFSKYPSDHQRLILAHTLLRKGEAAEAQSLLQSLAGELKDPSSLIQLGDLEASAKNTDAALAHYRPAVEILEDRFRQQPSSNLSATPWSNAVGRFLKLLSMTGQEELLRTAIQERLAFCDEISAMPDSHSVAFNLWNLLARVLYSMTEGEMPAAERLPQIIELYEKMDALDRQYPHIRKRIAWCYFELNKFDEAMEHLQRAAELDPLDRSMLTWKGADAISNCPSDAFVAALLPLADHALERNENNVGVQVMKAQVLRAIALRCQKMNLPETETLARQAFELSTALVQMTNCHDLSAQQDALHIIKPSLDILLRVFKSQGRQNETEQYVTQAVALYRDFGSEGVHTKQRRVILGGILWSLAEVMRESNRYSEAEAAAGEALQLFIQLAEEFPGEPYYRQETAFSHRILSGVLNAAGDSSAAVDHRQIALSIYQRLANEFPDNTFFRQEVAVTLGELTNALLLLDQAEDFQRHRDEAIALWREQIRLQPDDIQAPYNIVELLVIDERWDKVVEELNSVCEQTQTIMPRYWRGLAELALQDQAAYRETCGDLLKRFGKEPDEGGFALWTCVIAPDAVDDYGPLLQVAQSLEEKTAANPMLTKTIAAAYYRAGQNDEALRRLTEAAESTDDVSSPAYALYFLAMAQHVAGQLEEARQHLDQANQLTDAISAEHQEHRRSAPWNRRLTLQLLRSETEALLTSSDKKD